MFYHELRRSELCGNIRGCPEANSATCLDCLHTYLTDGDIVDPCPNCGSGQYRLERCATCPITKLNEAVSESPISTRFHSTLNLDSALQMGLHVPLAGLSVEAFEDLKSLHSERNRYENERAKEAHSKNH